MVLILVGLMVFPIGLPVLGSTTGYFWNTEINQEFVGQVNKWFWKRKTVVTYVFLLVFGILVWLWRKILYSPRKSAVNALFLSYFTFVITPIGTQYLVMGDWDKFDYATYHRTFDDSITYMAIATRIDNPINYLRNIKDYAGIDGQLVQRQS